MKKIIGYLFKAVMIFFVILTLYFAYLSVFNKGLILEGLDYIKGIVASLGYWNYVIILFFGFIESFPLIGISVPGQMVLVVIAGFLGYDGMLLAGICASLGALFGNYTGYLMGKVYGDSFFKKYGNWIGVGQTEIKYIKKGIDKQGWLWVLFGKFHNLLRAFVPFIAGSSHMNNFSFMVSNILGSILRAGTMVFVGVFFVENAEIILKNIGKVILGVIVLFAIYIYLFKKEHFKKYLEEKNKEIEESLKIKRN